MPKKSISHYESANKISININKILLDIELLDLQDKNISISFHDSLIKDQIDIAHIQSLFMNSSNIFHTLYFPIFFKKSNEYHLVARHWIYKFYVSNLIFKLPSLIFSDETLISKISEIDKIEISHFSKINSSTIKPHIHESFPKKMISKKKTTLSRYKAKEAGRICPICGEALLSPREQAVYKKEGWYRISCFNKSKKGKRCDFYAKLNEIEFKIFYKYQLPTHQWLQLIANRKCPICNSPLYLRKIHKPDGNIEYYEKCRYHHLSTEKECKHYKCLDNKP